MGEPRFFARALGRLVLALGLSASAASGQVEEASASKGGESASGGEDTGSAEEISTDQVEADGAGSTGDDAAATAESEGQLSGSEADSEESGEDPDDDLAAEEDPKSPRPQEGEPALTDTTGELPLEDQKDWLNWPFSKKNQRDPKQSEPHRWASIGGFVGWVHRSSGSDAIKYRPGIAWGGYLRPELVSWMGLRLFYREERIPAEVESGAFDYGEDSYEDEFEQPDLEMLNLGARLEPTLVLHPRVRLRGIAGWSWLWFRAPFPKSDEFELKRTFRQAVQMDFSFGLGASLDIIENWIDISLDSTYSVPAGRTGSAYEPAQIVRDGRIQHIAPLPELQNSLDVLISLGVIL